MSATILHPTQEEVQRSLASRQTSYQQDLPPSRLLERRAAQHHANFTSLTNKTNTAQGQSVRFHSNTAVYSEQDVEDDGRPRSSTPFPDHHHIPSNTFVETQSESIQKIIRPRSDQLNHKITGLAANHVAQREASYPADSQRSQVDPDYVAGRRMRDILAHKAFYTTSTQKLYHGVDWPRRIVPSPPPPETTKEFCADMVTFRNESKRYESHSEPWQKFGSTSRPFSWDYVQLRYGHHIPGPILFCSPNKKIVHIPGYMGHVTDGRDEMDNPSSISLPQNKLQTLQPRYSDTARKANIPGYTGCVLYRDYQPASSNDPDHLRSTASKTYRLHDEVLCNSRSPFKKTSAMSGMVTLTHPFNPFNKVH